MHRNYVNLVMTMFANEFAKQVIIQKSKLIFEYRKLRSCVSPVRLIYIMPDFTMNLAFFNFQVKTILLVFYSMKV